MGVTDVQVGISFSDRLSVAADVLFRLIDDEAVILNLRTETYLGLDPIGARMWLALKDAPSIDSAYKTLLREYDVDSERLRQDMTEFIRELIDQGLVQPVSTSVS